MLSSNLRELKKDIYSYCLHALGENISSIIVNQDNPREITKKKSLCGLLSHKAVFDLNLAVGMKA